MGFLDFLRPKNIGNSVTQSTIRQMCEVLRPKVGSDYSDATSTSKYRSWVYVAANHNASNIADGELQLYSNSKPLASRGKQVTAATLKDIRKYALKASSDTQEIETHPILDLLHNPNPRDTLYDLLYRTDLFLELAGDAYWHIKRDARGIPVEINVLYSQYVNIQHNGMNRIIAYNYGIPQDGTYQYNFDPTDIVHFKFFDPDDVFHGISPLQASARSYGLIDSMTTYEEALNRNMGVPSGMLKYTNQSIKPEDRQLIESKWQQKFSSVGRAGKLIVTDQNMDYQDLGINPRDMQFMDGRKWSREEILACFGVNPGLLLTEHTNYSNMVTASKNYYHNTLNPRFKLISQTITRRLLNPNGISGKDLFVVIGKPAPEDEELVLKRAELLSRNAALEVNELRKLLHMDPDPRWEGQVTVQQSANQGAKA